MGGGCGDSVGVLRILSPIYRVTPLLQLSAAETAGSEKLTPLCL
jgi:hypothetical protein